MSRPCEKPRVGPFAAAVGSAAVLATLLSGCGEETSPAPATGSQLTLTIVSVDWNGWDREHRPTPETTTLAAEIGESAELEGLGEDPAQLEVVDVRDDAVEVVISADMAPRGESGGLDLNGTEDAFVVELGDEIKFATPTTDAGITYTLTLAPQQ